MMDLDKLNDSTHDRRNRYGSAGKVENSQFIIILFTSRPFLKNGGRYCFGVRRRIRRLNPRFALYLGGY